MARKRSKKAPEPKAGGASPAPLRLLFVAGVAALAFAAQLYLKTAAVEVRAAAADRELMARVAAPASAPGQFDRAIAWCSQHWDTTASKIAELQLENLKRDAGDGGAAATVANLMIRATEQDMRSSNWSATSAIAAPSALATKYRDVLSSAAALLRTAAVPDNETLPGHHGAHYSLALVYKLYPSLAAHGADPGAVADAGAAHLCAAQRATVATIAAEHRPAAGIPLAKRVRDACARVDLVRDWHAAPRVSLEPTAADDRVFVATIVAPPNGSLAVQGLDALLHDLPIGDPGPDEFEDDFQPRDCAIYAGPSRCYPALFRQFDNRHVEARPRTLELDAFAYVDGFSGSSYYHWLVETLPKLLLLGDELDARGLRNVPLLLPSGGPFIEATMQLAGRDAFRPFGTLHKRDAALVVTGTRATTVTWDPAPGVHGGAGAVLRPLPSLLRRARAALLPADPARRATRVVLVGRGPAESRAFGNQEALMAALAHVASQRNLDFTLFEGAATPMRDAVDLFASAALVVGVHGAGLANCLFMAPGAAVLELALPESEFGEYAAMAAALGLAYAASPLPHSNFEARAWPRPSNVAAAAATLLDA